MNKAISKYIHCSTERLAVQIQRYTHNEGTPPEVITLEVITKVENIIQVDVVTIEIIIIITVTSISQKNLYTR